MTQKRAHFVREKNRAEGRGEWKKDISRLYWKSCGISTRGPPTSWFLSSPRPCPNMVTFESSMYAASLLKLCISFLLTPSPSPFHTVFVLRAFGSPLMYCLYKRQLVLLYRPSCPCILLNTFEKCYC